MAKVVELLKVRQSFVNTNAHPVQYWYVIHDTKRWVGYGIFN